MIKRQRIGIIARGMTQGGVGRFLSELVHRLENSNEYEYIVFTDQSLKISNNHITQIQTLSLPKIVWDWFYFPYLALRHSLDVIFYTKNIIPLTHIFLRSAKKIVVIYDVAFFRPELQAYRFWDSLYMKIFLAFSVQFADTVTTISEFTKQEILHFLGKKYGKKIKVIHLAASDVFFTSPSSKEIKATLKKYHIEKPYAFYVGSVSPRKNLSGFLKAYRKQPSTLKNFYIFSGKHWKTEQLVEQLETGSHDSVFLKGSVSETELRDLYSEATYFIYPSLYEGFGLPIIEAGVCGTPVIMSDEGIKNSVVSELDHTLSSSLYEGFSQVSVTGPIMNRTYDDMSQEYREVFQEMAKDDDE